MIKDGSCFIRSSHKDSSFKNHFLKKQEILPEVPGWSAPNNIDIRQDGVDRLDDHLYPLLLLVPENFKAELHINLAHVGDISATTTGELHAAQESKVDSFPDPGPRVHSNIQLCSDHHSVVFKQFYLKSVFTKPQIMSVSWKNLLLVMLR